MHGYLFGGQFHQCFRNDDSLKKVLLHLPHLYFEQFLTCFLYVFSPQIDMRQCEQEYTLLEHIYDKLLCFITSEFMSIFDFDEVCPALQSITVAS